MDKNEWYRAGENIRDQVQQAVETGNFANLGKNIGDTVNETLNSTVREVNRTVETVGEGVNRVVNGVGDSVNRTAEVVGNSISRAMGQRAPGASGQSGSRYANLPQYRRPNARPDTRLFQNVPKGSVSGVVCMGAGFGVMGLFLLALLSAAVDFMYGYSVVELIGYGLFAVGGFVLGCHGVGLKGRARRYRRYVDLVKDKLYCSIHDMAERTGKSERFIIKDLKKMIHLGMFRQAHLDQKETCLIASDEMYGQYMLAQKDYEEQQKKLEAEKQAEERKAQETARLGEAAKVIEEGKSYVGLIRRCNDEIPGEEMSDKLDRLETLVTRIFDRVEEEPELAPELRKMLSFYLPTTKKLLEAYRDLDRQPDLSNVAQTKREIETAVDNINEAFEKFLDELFREKAWDIQSDISALHTILKQDGYL